MLSDVCKDKIQLCRQQTHLEFGGCRTEKKNRRNNKGKRKINQIPSQHHLCRGETDTKVFKRLAKASLCCRRSPKRGRGAQAGSAPTAGSQFSGSKWTWVIHNTCLATVTLALFTACFCMRNLLRFKHSKSNKAIKTWMKQRDRIGLIFPPQNPVNLDL